MSRRVLGALVVGIPLMLVSATLFAGTSVGTAGTTRGPSPSELARGRVLFQNVSRDNLRCGFCHALASAKTTGPFAVNLDEEFSLDRKDGYSDARIRREILSYLANPPCYEPTNPNRCMPKAQYTGAKAAAVATFVATCAGRSTTLRSCRPAAGGLSAQAALGEHLYVTNGCPSCHWSLSGNSVGPSLYGLYGSRVNLTGGKAVKAGDQYLLSSILAPDADTVRGYPHGLMSARLRPGLVSVAQAKAIVAYLKTLKK
jgi:cytochrome c551/c552